MRRRARAEQRRRRARLAGAGRSLHEGDAAAERGAHRLELRRVERGRVVVEPARRRAAPPPARRLPEPRHEARRLRGGLSERRRRRRVLRCRAQRADDEPAELLAQRRVGGRQRRRCDGRERVLAPLKGRRARVARQAELRPATAAATRQRLRQRAAHHLDVARRVLQHDALDRPLAAAVGAAGSSVGRVVVQQRRRQHGCVALGERNHVALAKAVLRQPR